MPVFKSKASWFTGSFVAGAAALLGLPGASQVAHPQGTGDALQSACTLAGVQAVASKTDPGLTIKAVGAPGVPTGIRYVPANGSLPAYCQATGSFVTNPMTGKTANFLATFPANWNGKYLQYGCFGHCGGFILNDAASPLVTFISQGQPGDALRKGYASFGTDQGHSGSSWAAWAYRAQGGVDQDAIDDFYYRADKVLAQKGKQLAIAFYDALGDRRSLSYSYFMGCSGGGRDALVAATFFPEMFDGIVAGAPYSDMIGVSFQGTGTALATIRSPAADVPPELVALIDPIVKAQCDKLDGVADGLIQNPAACNFQPFRDLPRCEAGRAPGQCFTREQAETISTVLTAVTDEHGALVQPGHSVSEIDAGFRPPSRPANLSDPAPWPDVTAGGAGLASSAFAILRAFVHPGDPAFAVRPMFDFRQGGSGALSNYRIVVPRTEVDRARAATRVGIGAHPELLRTMIAQNRKLLIWHNLSDRALTPYMSINYYKQLAKLNGGYAKLQDDVRLFALPGTSHCSTGGIGPGSFDALGTIENWVERGQAPDALPAALYPVRGLSADFSKPPVRTMPLCKFPEMARYAGRGDVNDAANWRCSPNDRRMLIVGESGRQAGVLR